MWKTNRYAYASALPAIAAALALTSTPAWAQEVSPPTAEPEPVTIAPPPPADVAPTGMDSAAETDPTPVDDAVIEKTAVNPKSRPAQTKAVRTAVAKKPATASVTHKPTPAPADMAMAVPAATPPAVEERPAPTARAIPGPQEGKPALEVDETTIMLGGGALALLALGGAGVALARRRRDEDEGVTEESIIDEPTTVAPEPLPRHDIVHEEQPAIIAPSAFAWGSEQLAEPSLEADRRPGETWVDRAYRGPTPDNPSLSLRKRLKRANFFDARERRVAVGRAERVDADAGLPESATDRELELA